MDFNRTPIELGAAFAANRLSMDSFSNMSDDEKKEYLERHRSTLSDTEIDRLTASIGQDEDDGPNFGSLPKMF